MFITSTIVSPAARGAYQAPATAPVEESANSPDEVKLSTGEKLAKFGRAATTVGHTAVTIRDAFPDFIYPSIHNARATEHLQITKILDDLPLHHVSQVDTISMVPEIANDRPGWVTLGTAWDYPASSEIRLSHKELTTFNKMADTLIHEVGHTTDYSRRPFRLGPTASSHAPYGEGGRVSSYAETNAREDYAESYQEYHQRPERLQKIDAQKYEDQKRSNTPSFMEKLVDRKEFRETGKTIGKMMGPNKTTRHVIENGQVVAGLLQFGNGLTQWANSADASDPLQHASGILNTASGALAASGASPLAAVGVQAANTALVRAVKRGDLSAEEVESTISLPVRPIESVLGAKVARIADDHRPGKVAAVAVGGGLGGTAGTFVGPYLGVLAGYHVAGGIGGAVGLVAGGALGFLGGSEIGGRLGGALADLAA